MYVTIIDAILLALLTCTCTYYMLHSLCVIISAHLCCIVLAILVHYTKHCSTCMILLPSFVEFSEPYELKGLCILIVRPLSVYFVYVWFVALIMNYVIGRE